MDIPYSFEYFWGPIIFLGQIIIFFIVAYLIQSTEYKNIYFLYSCVIVISLNQAQTASEDLSIDGEYTEGHELSI